MAFSQCLPLHAYVFFVAYSLGIFHFILRIILRKGKKIHYDVSIGTDCFGESHATNSIAGIEEPF
jgi:hypothetical protein